MLERSLRVAFAGALAGAVALLGLLVAGPTAAQAPIGPFTFSSAMTEGFEPAGTVGVDFPSDNNGVYVTFTYTDLPQGSSLSRIVRVDGQDYNWDEQNGALSCCTNGGSGRFGFPIVKRDNSEIGQLPGGSYEVLLYLNGPQVQAGGFGIEGGQGLDDSGDNDNEDGGDNLENDNDLGDDNTVDDDNLENDNDI
jgi:hypothetical protein